MFNFFEFCRQNELPRIVSFLSVNFFLSCCLVLAGKKGGFCFTISFFYQPLPGGFTYDIFSIFVRFSLRLEGKKLFFCLSSIFHHVFYLKEKVELIILLSLSSGSNGKGKLLLLCLWCFSLKFCRKRKSVFSSAFSFTSSCPRKGKSPVGFTFFLLLVLPVKHLTFGVILFLSLLGEDIGR